MKYIFSKFLLLLLGIIIFVPIAPLNAQKKAQSTEEKSDDMPKRLESLPGNNFSKSWPKSSNLTDKLLAKEGTQDNGLYVYETEHFIYYVDEPLSLNTIRDIGRVFEGTYQANLSLPLNSVCNYYQVSQRGKFRARLYKTRDGYIQELKKRFPGQEHILKSAGIFIYRGTMESGQILVPFQSLGLEKKGKAYAKTRNASVKVLSHEITHFMTMPGTNLPLWFSEGLADYVAVTPYTNGRFNFSANKRAVQDYVSKFDKRDRSGRNLGNTIRVNSLKQFINIDQASFLNNNPSFNYGFSLLLIYYFFHLDGNKDGARAKKFIEAIQNKKPLSEAEKLLLDGRSWEELENDIAKGLKSLKFKVVFGSK